MRKCIIILIVAFCSCPVWAKAPEKTGMQQYADSLQRVCIEMNQMNERLRQEKDSIIAQIRSEYETDMNRYHTHINWNIAIIGLLFTGVLAGAGFLANKDVALMLTKTRKRIIGLNKDLNDYKNNLTKIGADLAAQIEKNTNLVKQLNDIKEHVDTAEKTINSIKIQIDNSAKAAKESEEKASAIALFAWARQLHKDDPDRAIRIYKRSIEKKPDFTEAFINRGFLYFYKEKYDEAISDLSKAIELNPKSANCYLYRGRVYMKRGNSGDYLLAKKDFETCNSLNPKEKTRMKLEKKMAELKKMLGEG